MQINRPEFGVNNAPVPACRISRAITEHLAKQANVLRGELRFGREIVPLFTAGDPLVTKIRNPHTFRLEDVLVTRVELHPETHERVRREHDHRIPFLLHIIRETPDVVTPIPER